MTIKFKIARHVKMRGIKTNLSLLLNELKFNIFKKDSCTNPIYFDEKKKKKKKEKGQGHQVTIQSKYILDSSMHAF